MGVTSQNSTLSCTIATFPVSLPLSSPGDVCPRLTLLPSTRPWTSARPPSPPQPRPQPLMPALSSPPLCQTPGCRSVNSRSTLSPSHPVLSVLRPQGFRTKFALATARRSFGWASPPTKKSSRTQQRCLNALAPDYLKGPVVRGHPVVWSLALRPDDAKQDHPVMYGTKFGVVVFLAEDPHTTASIHKGFDWFGLYHPGLEGERDFQLVVELPWVPPDAHPTCAGLPGDFNGHIRGFGHGAP